MAGLKNPISTTNVNGNERNNEKINLVNGSDVQFEYNNNQNNNTKSDSKKKKKKKKSKAKKSQQQNVEGETIKELDFDDPDFEYPDSRILKQNSNGDVIVQSLEPNPKAKKPNSSSSENANDKHPKKKSNSIPSSGFIPEDQDDLNEQLKEYWASLSADEKKELLNLERDSVFKVMKEQQKITCNCSVCGRKRQIIEQELKKLYDNYFDGIDTQELIAAELFNINNQQSYKKHQHQQQQQQSRSRKGSGTNLQQPHPSQQQQQQQSQPQQSQQVQQPQQQQQHPTQSSDVQRRNGIMSVAEDLLQNDGKKFLEMMEKLAESRIQRQNQYIRRNEMMKSNQANNQIEEEEEEEPEYYDDEDEDEDDEEEEEEEDDDDDEEELDEEYEGEEDYEDGEDHHHTHSHSHSHDHHHHDHHGHNHNHTHSHNHNEHGEEFEDDNDEFNTDDEMDRRNMIQLQLQRQRQLQKQLQREREELAQLQDDYVDGDQRLEQLQHQQAQVEAQQQKLQELADQQKQLETHSYLSQQAQQQSQQPQPQITGDLDIEEEEEEFEDDIEDEEEYSDDPIDEEQQLEEGRAMLQLCTTKMLRQSLLESYKRKKQEEYVKNLLSELDEEKLREKQKEEKKQREKEKKREKKRLIQQQKEEERLKKEAEIERLKREKEEENKRKIEEGRKRKQEEERKKLEEKRRKEAEKREREERKKQQQEAKKKKEEEEKRIKEEEQLRIQKQKEEEEKSRLQKQQEEEKRQQEILKLQQEHEELKRKQQEEDELRRQQQEAFARQQQERSNSTHSIPDQFSQPQIPTSTNPLLDNLYHQTNTPFASSPLGSQAGLSRHQQQQPQLPRNDTPPGFQLNPGSATLGVNSGLDTQYSHLTNPSAASLFNSRNFSENLPSVRSPWNTNGTSTTSNNNSLFNPLDKSFNLFSQPQPPQLSQPQPPQQQQQQSPPNDPSIDLLSNSLASTNFEANSTNNFNSSFLSGSKVWSTSSANTGLNGVVNGANTWSASTTKNLNGGGLWGTPINSSPSTQTLGGATQLNSNGGNNFLPSQYQQHHSAPNSQPSTTIHPSSQPPSSSNVDQLIKNYQSQIYQAYTYLRSSFLDGGFILIDTLFTTFNSLQPPNSALTFALFLSIIKTKTSLYNFETIGDELGNVTHVKITPFQQQLNPLNSNVSRTGSLPFNQFGNGGANDGLYADPRRNTSFDTNGSGLTWGGSLI